MARRKFKPTPSAYDYQLIIKHMLRNPMIYSPDKEIIYRDISRYTYRTFEKRVAQLANVLSSFDVESGDTVAIMDWDSHRYLESYFAVPMMGAILHTINIRLASEQLVYTINHAEDDIILLNTEFLPLLEAVWGQIKYVGKIILIDEKNSGPETTLPIVGEYEALMGQSDDRYDFPDLDENTVATVFYTTGTTGEPKGVFFSHRQLVLHTLGLVSALSLYKSQFNISAEDVYMPITPMFHVHAWGIPYLMTFIGAKQIYPGRYEPDMLLKLLEVEKVTFSHCIPTILNILLNTPESSEVDLTGWKVVIGGAAMPRELCKEAMARGINPISGYGLSETCPVLTIANLKPHMLEWDSEKQVDVRCSAGLPTPLVQLEVVDPMGNPMPHDGLSVGEIVVRTPWLTQGYLKESEKSEALWEESRLHTGDIGHINPEGYLHITDRIKDVIKTGGEWISSLELEDIITQHEAVSEAAVIGVPDDKWGERPIALVVLREEYRDKVTEEDLKQFYMSFVEKGQLPLFGVPNKILLIDNIAKTSVGKINKREIRRMIF
jgi:acyl-CoA synthetase (AMP-forming)/AMP-acid ligase II